MFMTNKTMTNQKHNKFKNFPIEEQKVPNGMISEDI